MGRHPNALAGYRDAPFCNKNWLEQKEIQSFLNKGSTTYPGILHSNVLITVVKFVGFSQLSEVGFISVGGFIHFAQVT
jgi:hypothetical protein